MISRYPDVTGAALLLMRLACALIVYPALARLWPVLLGKRPSWLRGVLLNSPTAGGRGDDAPPCRDHPAARR